jgi:hypothetical protein
VLRKVGQVITLSANGNTRTLICNKSNGWNVLGQIASAEADGENLFGGERHTRPRSGRVARNERGGFLRLYSCE